MHPRRALLIEDDVLTHWMVSEMLSSAGYDVVSACRGAEAARIMGADIGLDLLICDLDLPDNTSAVEIGRAWRRVAPGKPAIFTGLRWHPAIQRLHPHETFLAKPFSTQTLLQVIDAACEDAIFRPAATNDTPCCLH